MRKINEILAGLAAGFLSTAIVSVISYLHGGDLIQTVFETGLISMILLAIMPLVLIAAIRSKDLDYGRNRHAAYVCIGISLGAMVTDWTVHFIRLLVLPGTYLKSLAISAWVIEPTAIAWILGLIDTVLIAFIAAHYQNKIEEIRIISKIPNRQYFQQMMQKVN